MNEEEKLFISVGESIENSVKSQMFGKACFKLNKKAFVCFFQNEMVFKLNGESHREALSMDGAQLFDPSGKGRAMKEWVQLPFHCKDLWPKFAIQSAAYISSIA